MSTCENDPLVREAALPREHTFDAPLEGAQLYAERRNTLALWMTVVALVHFDRGVTSAVALEMIAAWETDLASHLSLAFVVSMLAGHAVGLAAGAVLARAAFQQLPHKLLLVVAPVVDAVALMGLGLQTEPGLLVVLLLRAASGVAAAFPLAYMPLWVDAFSPSEGHGRWMVMVQAGAPMGQFAGTVATVVMASKGLDWRWALVLQAVLLLPIALRVLFMSAPQLDAESRHSSRARIDAFSVYPLEGSIAWQWSHRVQETRESLQAAFRNPLTPYVFGALCLLHGTGACLSLWAGPFLAMGVGAPARPVAQTLAAALLACLPVLGVHAGASLCSRLDGFKAGQNATALKIAASVTVLAVLSGPASIWASSFGMRLGIIALWLFGAGGCLPVCVGILMTSMPSYLRAFSSTVGVVAFQSIGFCVVPIVVALLMACVARPDESIGCGVGVALWLTAVALVLLIMAYAHAPKFSSQAGLSGVDDLPPSDIGFEVARRRLTTAPL